MSASPPRNWFRSLIGAAPAPAPVETAAPSPPPFDFDDPRIPDTSRERLDTIRSLFTELAGGDPQTPAAVGGQVEAERIRDVYLPELMRSYFAIPPQHRAEIFRATGRSASFLLNERLDKLAARLREISRRIAQSPLDSFNQNLGFLDSRFDDPDAIFGERD